MKPPRNLYISILLSLLLAVLSSCSLSLAEDITPPPGSQQQFVPQTQAVPVTGPLYPIVPPDPVKGEAIYTEKCAPCHGSEGMGDGQRTTQLTVPVSAIGSPEVARRSTPAEWFTLVTQGNLERFMPPFPSLTDRQKWDVIAYVYTLSVSEEVVAEGAALYQENCAQCHGSTGQGNGPKASDLSTPVQDYTDQSYMADISASDLFEAISAGVPPDMPAYGERMSADERWALTAFLRTFTFVVPVQVATSAEEITLESTPVETPSVEEPTPAPTQETSSNITVEVLNGSGGGSLGDLEVTIYGFDEMQVVFSQTLTTGEDGVLVFENIGMPLGRAFLATTDFQASTYGSDVAVVDAGPIELSLSITVYETTTDTSVLVTDRAHIFFDFTEPGKVQVIELYVISNPSNKRVVAAEEGGPVVTFSLPQGITNLEFQDGLLGERYLEVLGGFADTLSVSPGSGEYQVLYAFEMPYNRKLELVQPIDLATNAVVVMLPDVGVEVDSDLLSDGGVRQAQDIAYRMYTGGSVRAGSELTLSLSGRPKLGGNTLFPSDSKTSLVIGLGTFGLALILAGVWLIRRSQVAGVGEADEGDLGQEPATSPPAPLLEDAETVMDAIIALDDLYQDGRLPEEAYLKRRAELKGRLQGLVDSGD